jgi:Rps23 Pro-64 3,4-dihydroxylase Tpa1-like proline 4-hydroxylase
MFDINKVYKIENLLSEEEIKGLDYFCDTFVWDFIAKSGVTSNDRIFWFKDLWESKWGKSKEIETTLKQKIETTFDIKIETQRLYLNGQAHGQCGSMHTDMNGDLIPGDFMTMVYYTNKTWTPEQGGFTVVIDINDDMHIIYPKPNSAVFFNSNFSHVGLEPTIHCKDQRVTLAHKFKVIQ